MIDSLEIIERLLVYADPELETHKKLLRIKDKIERNVMLGPKANDFLESLLVKIDNIECKKLRFDGTCSVIGKGNCSHSKKFSECLDYSPQTGVMRGSPLAGFEGNTNE